MSLKKSFGHSSPNLTTNKKLHERLVMEIRQSTKNSLVNVMAFRWIQDGPKRNEKVT